MQSPVEIIASRFANEVVNHALTAARLEQANADNLKLKEELAKCAEIGRADLRLSPGKEG